MASAQVVETLVTNNSPSQDSNHSDNLFQSRFCLQKNFVESSVKSHDEAQLYESCCRNVNFMKVVVEMSVTNNSPSQDSNHPDDLFNQGLFFLAYYYVVQQK